MIRKQMKYYKLWISDDPDEKRLFIKQFLILFDLFKENKISEQDCKDNGVIFDYSEIPYFIHDFFLDENLKSVEEFDKVKRYDCLYCSRYGAYTLIHIKRCHPDKYEFIKKYLISLFYEDDFQSELDYDKYGIPEFINFRDITDLWHEDPNISDIDIKNRFYKKRQISFLMNNSNRSYNEAKFIVNKNHELSNNNTCPRCNEYVTNNTWLVHNKTYHNDYYQKQLRLAIQCFDNLDFCQIEDYRNFGLDCSMDNILEIWKNEFGEIKTNCRTRKFAGRQNKKNNSTNIHALNWSTLGDDLLSIEELKEKHSQNINDDHVTLAQILNRVFNSGILLPRKDLPDYPGFRSTWEANLARIFQYHHKRFEYEECFQFPDEFNRTIRGYIEYYPDFHDVDNLFGFGPNTYIEVKGQYDTHAKEKEYLFKKYCHDKKLIFMGIPKDDFNPEINYSDLIKKYSNKINWETKTCNIYNYPEKFLNISDSKLKTCLEEFKKQEQLLIQLVKQNIPQKDFVKYGCYLKEQITDVIIYRNFSRIELSNYREKSKYTKTLHISPKSQSFWRPYKQYADSLSYTFENFKKIIPSNKEKICPLCKNTLKSRSFFRHFFEISIYDKEHSDLLDKEIKKVIEAYYDLNLSPKDCSLFDERSVRYIWRNTIKDYQQRYDITTNSNKHHMILSSINWDINWIKSHYKEVKATIPITKTYPFGLWNHLIITKQFDLLYGQILFIYNHYDDLNFNRNNLTGCLFSYQNILVIWDKLLLDSNKRKRNEYKYLKG